VCIVAFGLIGAGLLSTRQSRLQAAHEVTAARLRIRDHDERLLTLRAQIAEHATPDAVRKLLEEHRDLDQLVPIAGRARVLPDSADDFARAPGDITPEADLPDEIEQLLRELNSEAGTPRGRTGLGH
jgi:hypothetical protein